MEDVGLHFLVSSLYGGGDIMRLKFNVLHDGTLVVSHNKRLDFLSEFERTLESHPESFIGIDEDSHEFVINKR